jgi:hypothetical protein
MKRGRFTEEQITAVLREHEVGAKTADLARQALTTGRPNTAAWKYPKPSGCGRWKTRTAS